MGVRDDIHYIRKNWHRPDRRPIWQMLLLLPLWLLYKPARWFVDWMDGL